MYTQAELNEAIEAAATGNANNRLIRMGAYVYKFAQQMGWKDDGGEGAVEFLIRRTREVAFEDCGRSTNTMR